MRKLNEAGINLIKQFEGCVLHVYADPGSKDRPYTAGYGHAGDDIQHMDIGHPITQSQADQWLRQDVSHTCAAVDSFCTGTKLTDNQFAALVSFAYNIGSWRKSHLFSSIKTGALDDAASVFPLYNTAAGKVLTGLTRRRLAEQKLFKT